MDQIGDAMNFNSIRARLNRALRRVSVIFNSGLNLPDAQSPRHGNVFHAVQRVDLLARGDS
ncbi:hypothetical protein AWB73_05344 [Caballeronia turbans]|nr:hypothetical protein AWB73_05344 [Caballeronia turbans]